MLPGGRTSAGHLDHVIAQRNLPLRRRHHRLRRHTLTTCMTTAGPPMQIRPIRRIPGLDARRVLRGHEQELDLFGADLVQPGTLGRRRVQRGQDLDRHGYGRRERTPVRVPAADSAFVDDILLAHRVRAGQTQTGEQAGVLRIGAADHRRFVASRGQRHPGMVQSGAATHRQQPTIRSDRPDPTPPIRIQVHLTAMNPPPPRLRVQNRRSPPSFLGGRAKRHCPVRPRTRARAVTHIVNIPTPSGGSTGTLKPARRPTPTG